MLAQLTSALAQSTWENPAPAIEISHLEFEIGDTAAIPFVVAITAE